MRARALYMATAIGCCLPTAALAHAPLARELARAPNGGGVAIRMPGFGWVVRETDDAPFAYVCDALVGVELGETETPFVYRADGSLLVGTAHGLARLAPDGCPASIEASELATAPIAKLAAHRDDPDLVYAVRSGENAGVYRSTDGGERWEARSSLPADEPVTALVLVGGAPDEVYLTRSRIDEPPTLAHSTDGGTSFESFALEAETVLLHAEAGPDGALWARAPADAPPRVALLRATAPDGPWENALRLNFFGGFATEPGTRVLWAGDEGGGVWRSDDGGDRFDDLGTARGVACLHHDGHALWACTPDTPDEPAVVTLDGSGQELDVVSVLADVDRLVECDASLDVANVCAAAWREWEVDVRSWGAAGGSVTSTDAAVADDGGAPLAAPDAGPRAGATGCGIATHLTARSRSTPATVAFLVCCLLVGCRARVGAPMRESPPSKPREDVPRPPGDAALMARAGLGDVDAFAEIYDRHAPSVLALLQRITKSDPEARDLLHDVFLEAWRAVRTYDAARASVRTWLVVRARSRALDRLGRRAREDEARRVLRPAHARAAERTTGPEGRLAVRRALADLDADVRATLELTYYEGLTAAEIGGRMDVPVGTVKSRLARGLKRLASVIGDGGGTRDGA